MAAYTTAGRAEFAIFSPLLADRPLNGERLMCREVSARSAGICMRESVRKSGGFEKALVYHINFSFVEPALLLRSPSEGLRKVLVVISNIEDAVDFIRE
jgi:hypothetical protein